MVPNSIHECRQVRQEPWCLKALITVPAPKAIFARFQPRSHVFPNTMGTFSQEHRST